MMSRRAERPDTGSSGTARRSWAVLAHLSPLLVAVSASVLAGRPYGWIGFLFPSGPILVGVLMSAATRGSTPQRPRGFRSLLGFSIVSAILVGGGWTLTQAGQWWTPLAVVFPFALLVFTLGVVNFVMVTISRTLRAWKGQQFDYPWVISPIARLVGLPPIWEE